MRCHAHAHVGVAAYSTYPVLAGPRQQETIMERRPRPIGVWIATIWAGLFAGLFPLALMLFFCFGPANGYEIVGPIAVLLSVCLGVGVILAAIGTWTGNGTARYALAALVLIHYGLVAYQNYQLVAAGIEVRGSAALPFGRVVRSILTASLIAGYLLVSRGARSFSNRRSEPALNPNSN